MLNGIGQAELDPPEPAVDIPRRRLLPTIAGVAVGVLALLAALAVPFAPVLTQRVTVTWPAAGQPAVSTVAFVVPYQPAEVHVQVPCPVLQAGSGRTAPTTLVASRPPGQPTQGFAVTTAHEHVIALVAGREAARAPVNEACAGGVSIDADTTGSSARIGARTVTLPGARISDIVAFATDLTAQEAAGTQVRVVTGNWFETSPTGAKKVLLAAQLLLAAIGFGMLLWLDRRRRGPAPVNIRDALPGDLAAGGQRGRILAHLVDLVLLGVLGVWWVFGPTTPDDSFAAVTIENGVRTGEIGNYYRWENASESPFTLVQQLLVPIAAHSPDPLTMRLPSVLAAVLTWLLLSRGVLGAVLPGRHRRPGVRALAALAFLAWWLPFGLGVRPEPFEALGLTATLACVLQAVRTGRAAFLGPAALAAGLSMAVNPMGTTAIAPFLVLAPQLRRLLSVPVTVLLAAIAATGLSAMFADQSFFGASKATLLHAYYGPDVPWFQEIQRYQYLLGFDLQGDLARRAPVLLTLVMTVYCGFLLLRGGRRLPGLRLAHVPPLCLLLGFALMALTPSKWTHYFGALAGIGAATLTAGVVLIGVAARRLSHDRMVLTAAALGTVLSGCVAALAFAGKNNWFLHSQYGVPWGEQPVRPLNSPAIWLLVAGILLISSVYTGFRSLHTGHWDRMRRMLIRIPAVISAGAVGVAVVLVLGSFLVAPARQADGYSIGGQQLAALRGDSCGIVDQLAVTPDVPGSALHADDSGEAIGFTEGTGYAPGFVPPDEVRQVWGSLTGGQISTGTLTTGWFGLPQLGPDQELAVAVAGRSGDGNRIALEFATPDGVTTERVLDDTALDSDERRSYPSDHVVVDRPQDHPAWRDLSVRAADIPAGADRVRIRAVDGTTDPAGWVAVAGPRLRAVLPMRDYVLQQQVPVLVDWSMTWNAPCLRNLPRVVGGLVEPPGLLLTSPEALGFGGTAAFERSIGGTFAGVRDLGQWRELPTQLRGVDRTPEYPEWGHLIEVEYPYSGNLFDVQRVSVPRWGWKGE